MAQSTSTGDKRAQHVAALGFWLVVLVSATLFILGRWSVSSGVCLVSFFVSLGLPAWAVLYLIYRQARHVRAEQLETTELRRAKEAGTGNAIFEYEGEEFLIEQNRLRWMVRWLLPGTSVLMAAAILAASLLDWGWSISTAFQRHSDGGIARTVNPMLVLCVLIGIGFLCFLVSRWTITLSRLEDWRLLHGGATLMAGNALACLGMAIALMATASIDWAEPMFCVLLRIVIVLIGIEFTVNFVLDFYRPRQPGFVSRPSFDSRLLGLATEPGGVAKSIAEAVNYQFGFEVSSTWFYQLMQRWIVPLMAATALLIILLSSVVVVDADEQAVIERLGVVRTEAPLSAGLHFKLPYPIETVHRAPVLKVGEIVIGEATAEDVDPSKPVIWTEEHKYVPELMVLVAAPKQSGNAIKENLRAENGPFKDSTLKSVPVSLLQVSVPIEYRIKDVKKYLYNYTDPVGLLEGVAYHYLTNFASSVDIDQLLGPGRKKFNEELHDLIQHRLDELNVGIELAFVGVRGAHPPAKDNVAAKFQASISAQMQKQTLITSAKGEARRILTEVAGSEARARELDAAIRERDTLQSATTADPPKLADWDHKIDQMLDGDVAAGIEPLSGSAATLIANARAEAFKKRAEAAAKVRVFNTEAVAFEAAPKLYTQRRLLDIYRSLDAVRKYVILGDSSNVIIRYDTQEEGGLDRVLADKKK